jgi:TorA maturation chaperone TorD
MASLHDVRADDVFEPEDNISSLMEMMAGMIVGQFRRGLQAVQSRTVSSMRASESWATYYFNDLQAAKSSVLYICGRSWRCDGH